MRTNGKWLAIVWLSTSGLGCNEPEDGMPYVESAGDDEALEGEDEDEEDEGEDDSASAALDLAGQDCSEQGQVNPCSGEGMFNVCDEIDSRLQWGACHEIECAPGETETCREVGSGTCDSSNGVPYWTCDLRGAECDAPGELSFCAPGEHGQALYNSCLVREDGNTWSSCHEVECIPGEETGCGELTGTATCRVGEGGEPYWDCVDGTPLVLSFDGAEPVMTDASAAAAFDVGTGGECIQTDWPAAETPWLALDRDRSGTIDGGHELFGSGTVLAGGDRARHGFLALAELDSNGDGRITKADERFDQLVLWADHDRDKRSTHAEHQPLSASGIVAIELAWRDEQVCDERGNCGVERAAFTFVGAGGRVSVGEVVDVHLSCQ